MGGSYSVEALQEKIYGLKFEVEHFEGTIASRAYQKLQKDLIKTNSHVLKLKEYNKNQPTHEYDQMLNELNACLRELTLKVTHQNNSKNMDDIDYPDENEGEDDEYVELRRNPRRDALEIVKLYEEELTVIESEIENIMKSDDLKPLQILEAKLKIFCTQLAITQIDKKTPLDARRNAVFRRILRCYKKMKKDISRLAIAEDFDASDLDSDFNSDMESGSEASDLSRSGSRRTTGKKSRSFRIKKLESGSEASDLSRSGSTRTTWKKSRSFRIRKPSLREKPSQPLDVNSSNHNVDDYNDHIYENIEIILQEKRKLMESKLNPTNSEECSYYNEEALRRGSNEITYENIETAGTGRPDADLNLKTEELEHGKIYPPVPKYETNDSDAFLSDEDGSCELGTEAVEGQDPETLEENEAQQALPPIPKDRSESLDSDVFLTDEEDNVQDIWKKEQNKKDEQIEVTTKSVEGKEEISKHKEILAPVPKFKEDFSDDDVFLEDSDEEYLTPTVAKPTFQAAKEINRESNKTNELPEELKNPLQNVPETQFISDHEEDSDEDSPEALNLELLNKRQAYTGHRSTSEVEDRTRTEVSKRIKFQPRKEKAEERAEYEDRKVKLGKGKAEEMHNKKINQGSSGCYSTSLEEKYEDKALYKLNQNKEKKESSDSTGSSSSRGSYMTEDLCESRNHVPRIVTPGTSAHNLNKEESTDLPNKKEFADDTKKLLTNCKLRPRNTNRRDTSKRFSQSVDYTHKINEIIEAVKDLQLMNENFKRSKDKEIYSDMQSKLMRTTKNIFNMNGVNFDKKSLILYDIASKDIQEFINKM